MIAFLRINIFIFHDKMDIKKRLLAYGPMYKIGIKAYGAYVVNIDATTQQLYVETEKNGIEYLTKDGQVIGNDKKSYELKYELLL